MAQGTPGGGGVTDSGLAAAIAGALQGGGGGAGGGNTLDDLLKGTMLGMSGRQGLTAQPLTGLLPRWVRLNPQLLSAVRGGAVDPYVPTTDPSTWRVWTGSPKALKITHSTNAAVAEHAMKTGDTKPGDTTEMVNSVMNQPFLWSADEVAGAIKRFRAAGVTSVTDFDSMQKAWSGLVQRAGAMYSLSSGQRKVTPWDVLDLYKNEMTKAGTNGLGGGSGATTGVHTDVQKTVSQLSEGDAWAALRQTLSGMLGRDPKDQEVRDFTYRMNSLAAQNPSISKTITDYGNGTGDRKSTTTTKPGFGANDVAHAAYDQAQANPDYAEYQSATTYFNAALSALGQIGG